MKAQLLFAGVLMLARFAYPLPLYDDFSTYGSAGAVNWTNGAPNTSATGPLLGGNTAPSGESWILYTNVPAAMLTPNENVCVISNAFTTGGSNDLAAPNLPTNFPGPFVSGQDTSSNSLWTPGWYGTADTTNGLGGIGACLQFAGDVSGATVGQKIYASFFVDIPDCSTPYGAGQSLGHGWSCGFIPASELPGVSGANQNGQPAIFEKFNYRENNSSSWHAGLGDRTATSGAGTTSFSVLLSQHTIHFIVFDYEFNGGGTSDMQSCWIDPAATNFGGSVAPGATGTRANDSGNNLPDAGGFFFQAYSATSGSMPNSGVMFNGLRISTNWAYVTGGPQFTGFAPASTNIGSGQTLVLNSTAVAGGVPVTYAWQTNNGVNSGALIVGGRFSVGPTGALTIANVQPGDAGTYTLQVSTPITTENSVAPLTAATVVTVTSSTPLVFTSTSASGIGSGQFQMNFTGPAGSGYRLWSSTNAALAPITNTWTLLTNGAFAGGTNAFTDTSATNPEKYYVITVP